MPVKDRLEAEVQQARDLCIEARRLIDDALVIIEAIMESVDAVQRSAAASIMADRDPVSDVSADSGDFIGDKPGDQP